MTFKQLNLSPALLNALPKSITKPTDIQLLAIPDALAGQDILALAQTGSGKTLAFGLPVLQQIEQSIGKSTDKKNVQALVIVPTRELAQQVSEAFIQIATPLNINIAMLSGGVSQASQEQQINDGAQIIVATPGRLLDLLKQELFNTSEIKTLVLDEADRLLDMGFWPDIERIVTFLPAKLSNEPSASLAFPLETGKPRQTLLFSATLAPKLERLAHRLLTNPKRIEAHVANSVVSTVEEQLYLVNKGSKAKALQWLLTTNKWSQALVFISARDSADSFAKKLKKAGFNVAALHGEKDQKERQQTLQDFHNNKVNILIATDVLARGIDIDSLPVVINLDLPANAPVYVHRVGRTARAGNNGLAISLVSHGETKELEAIRELTNRALELKTLEEFPVTDKPASAESKRPPRDKKANRRTAKKKKSGGFKKPS